MAWALRLPARGSPQARFPLRGAGYLPGRCVVSLWEDLNSRLGVLFGTVISRKPRCSGEEVSQPESTCLWSFYLELSTE